MTQSNFPLYNSLLALNFSEKEACVYLALLELGKATVSEIARKAGINRTTGYNILAELAQKGLVSISGKEPKAEYAAESPDKIKQYINDRIKNDQTALKQADRIIPGLKSIHNIKGRPQVRFYEGREGMKQVYEDTLTSREPIRAYANVEDNKAVMPDYFPDYYFRRARKNISIRAIFPDNRAARELAEFDKIQIRETALVPEQFSFSPEINIYDNKIMIASWRENLGIIIESGEIAEAMKKAFELAWAEAKRLDAKIKKSKCAR